MLGNDRVAAQFVASRIVLSYKGSIYLTSGATVTGLAKAYNIRTHHRGYFVRKVQERKLHLSRRVIPSERSKSGKTSGHLETYIW
jgi:hypothetical protein